jgi:hypothetical protein
MLFPADIKAANPSGFFERWFGQFLYRSVAFKPLGVNGEFGHNLCLSWRHARTNRSCASRTSQLPAR